MRHVYIETYGCQMNLADTELVLGHLGRHGYARTDDPGRADVILLNTCAIRERAEARIYGRIGALARYKVERPEVRIGIAGCMAQHVRDRMLERIPQVDFVVGPDAYRRLPELLRGDPFVDVRLDRAETYADMAPARAAGVRAWVTVMRGCDRFCTFCIVPFVRGRERSLPAAELLKQVRAAAAAGYREVVFLGQTVNAYRDGDTDFASLLRAAARADGIERLRFTSPHPCDMSDALIEVMASEPRVCPQLHLPVQSGSAAVLERMERGYTADEYLSLVERLRAAIPDLAISTDIIVGFPGETAEDFAATLALMRRIRFDHAFMFQYSRREHTRAERWPETVPVEEKGRRLREVVALQEKIAAEINAGAVGSDVEVLVEGPARRGAGWLAGKTPQFKTAVFAGAGEQPGEFVSVRVVDATGHTLIGERLAFGRKNGIQEGKTLGST